MDFFEKLQMSRAWIDLGIVTPEKLPRLEAAWKLGEDPFPEHHRWRAFLEHLEALQSMDEWTATALYDLGGADPDRALGGSMRSAVLRRRDCPRSLILRAAASEEKFLRKIAEERLKTELPELN